MQFTRNPKGIAGALYKIQQATGAGWLNNSHAEDMSHMCFGEVIHVNMQSMLATHPPLEERIKAVDASFLKVQRAKDIIKERQQAPSSASSQFSDSSGIHANAADIAASVGNPTPEHMLYAAAMMQMFDESLMTQVHNTQGAKAVIYALLLSDMDMQTGLECLHQQGEEDLMERLQAIGSDIKQLNKRHRLPLIDLALPSLKQLDESQIKTFLQTVDTLIKCDQRYSLFEFVLFSILKKHLHKKAAGADKVKVYSFKPVLPELQLLLSLLVHTSRQSQQKKQAVFERSMQSFGASPDKVKLMAQCKPQHVIEVLDTLSQMSPLLKKSIIDACADAVVDDGIIMPAEAELLRAISETLDCPMPPLLDNV